MGNSSLQNRNLSVFIAKIIFTFSDIDKSHATGYFESFVVFSEKDLFSMKPLFVKPKIITNYSNLVGVAYYKSAHAYQVMPSNE